MPPARLARVSPIPTVTIPFATAEQAWLWAVKSMQSRLEGALVKPGMADMPRPCDASDVLGCANVLSRNGGLSSTEMRVLFLYGRHAIVPMALGDVHRPAIPFWQSAMAALTPILEQKGIIAQQDGRG
jgi:hypothetical protein